MFAIKQTPSVVIGSLSNAFAKFSLYAVLTVQLAKLSFNDN